MSDATRPLSDYSQTKDPYYKDTTTKMRILVDAPEGVPMPTPANLFSSKPLRSQGTFAHHDKDSKSNLISYRIGGEIGVRQKREALEAKEIKEKISSLEGRLALFEQKKTILFDLVTYDSLLSEEAVRDLEAKGRGLDARYEELVTNVKAISSLETASTHESAIATLETELADLNREIRTAIQAALKGKSVEAGEAAKKSGKLEDERRGQEEAFTILKETIPLFEYYAVAKADASAIERVAPLIRELDTLKAKIQTSPKKVDVSHFTDKLGELIANIKEEKAKKEETPLHKEVEYATEWPEDIFSIETKDGEEVWRLTQTDGTQVEVDGSFWSLEKKNFEAVYEKYEEARNRGDTRIGEFDKVKKDIIAAIRNNNLALAASLRSQLDEMLASPLEEEVVAPFRNEEAPAPTAQQPEAVPLATPEGDREALLAHHKALFSQNPISYIEKYSHKAWAEGDPERVVSEELMRLNYEELSNERGLLREHIKALENRINLGATQKGEDAQPELENLKNKLQILDDDIKKVAEFSYIQKIEALREAAKRKTLRSQAGARETVVPIILSKGPSPTPHFTTSSLENGPGVPKPEDRPLPASQNEDIATSSPSETPTDRDVTEPTPPAPQEVPKIIPPAPTPEPVQPSPSPSPQPVEQEPGEAVQAETPAPTTQPKSEAPDIVLEPNHAPEPTARRAPTPDTPEAKAKRKEACNKLFTTCMENMDTFFKKAKVHAENKWYYYATALVAGTIAGNQIGRAWPDKEPAKPTTLAQAVSWRDGMSKDDLGFLEDLSVKKLGFDGIVRSYAPLYRIDPNNPATRDLVSKLDIYALMKEQGAGCGLDAPTQEQLCGIVAKAHKMIQASKDKEGKVYEQFNINWDVPHITLEDFVSLALKSATEADTMEERIKKMI